MHNKIIIQNETNKSMAEVLFYVQKVLAGRTVAGHEGLSSITTFIDGVAVAARKFKASEKFIVFWEKEDEGTEGGN